MDRNHRPGRLPAKLLSAVLAHIIPSGSQNVDHYQLPDTLHLPTCQPCCCSSSLSTSISGSLAGLIQNLPGEGGTERLFGKILVLLPNLQGSLFAEVGVHV